MAPRWLSALVLTETLVGAMGFGPMASSTPATKQAAFGAARLDAALSSQAKISGSVRRLVLPRIKYGLGRPDPDWDQKDVFSVFNVVGLSNLVIGHIKALNCWRFFFFLSEVRNGGFGKQKKKG